ncbi:MAG: ABC transporter substrate-binding protein [Candidatus Thermofonsia Clade 1 bacterium]|jgi:glucose/mannose transport system substrate-binding protein|uniref:Probable sugar-binding periplasmic protein n=1 Tax=Candidatus Thermofonsia Clade 1 bacterium TaxID=2364210 RepID=A0A2M8PH85_9CHLR|nr:MAG: ABC transporter substrate-binding protein [Candidatus Thermofonsia Clade 1 bacterium]RMF53739.1 MAG: carbohydrate ABC transporter substrate-binding protein [Chloroflexota bacterium]
MNKRFYTLLLACVLVFATIGTVAAQGGGKLEIFSWWAGDEGPALESLIKLYNQKYNNVEVINATVTGGAGVAARAVLKTRMLGGNPPDSFQVHAGQELTGTWVVANRMEPLTELFRSEGWLDKFPKDLIDLITYNGEIWTVPVNIHRSNVMWYVPAKLQEWGVSVPATWDDFLAMCPMLKEKGVTPLAMGENWTAVHLFENVLLAQLGVEGYRNLFAGKLSWESDAVKAAWTLFDKILDCTNSDAASLSWQQANDLVIEGKAAFYIMGDWAAGYMTTTKGLKPGEGFGYAPAPGTAGVFNMLSDSFGLPKGAPNRENALAWLRLVGSVEGQDAFNPLKGSIPARIDADVKNPNLYNSYLQSAAADFAKDALVGSLMHGAAASEAFLNDFQTVVSVFIATRDVELAASASQALAETTYTR